MIKTTIRPVISATVLFLAASTACADTVVAPPRNVHATYSEKVIEVVWDSVEGAAGYNLYTAPAAGAPAPQRRRVNAKIITSGARFTYLWDVIDGSRVRGIKGVEHHLSVTTAVLSGTDTVESAFSTEIDNRYYDGFRNIGTAKAITAVLVKKQTGPFLPVPQKANRKQDFIKFMAGPGARLFAMVKAAFDPREVGACSPVTTILVRLMHESGIEAVKIEGTFISEYHSFAVVNIENVEYVLDFTADQFVPGVAPVLFPRDRSYLGTNARLSTSGTPVYQGARIYNAQQVNLAANAASDPYWEIYNAISTRKEMVRDTTIAPVPIPVQQQEQDTTAE